MSFAPRAARTPTRSRVLFSGCGLAAVALWFAFASSLWSQPHTPSKKELSKKVADARETIRTLTDAKRYDAAIASIEGLLKTAAPRSFEVAVLSRAKAEVLLTKGEYAKSIEPLELALRLAEQHGYFDARVNQEMRYYLAQLCYQEASTNKDLNHQKEFYARASSYIESWAKGNTLPNPEAQLFYASLLYNRAVVDPKYVDKDLLKRAQEESERGLTMSLKPKDTFYILLLATLQQQGETARSAEILELLVKKDPSNRAYWSQLASTYLNLHQDLRAALTIERMPPHDDLLDANQRIERLEKGLREGTIVNTQQNWELLVAELWNVRRELEAIEVLQRAIKAFPESGSLYVQIAQLYYSLERLDDAYVYAKQSISKQWENPRQALTFWAYLCYELKKYDEGLEAIHRALSYSEGRNEAAERLKKAIEDAIQVRGTAISSPAP